MRKYDVAIIGPGFGGLLAAALLNVSGKASVIVLSPSLPQAHMRAGGAFIDDLFFPLGPALTYGFEKDGMFQCLLKDIGLPDEMTAPANAYQVVLPDRRLTVFPEWSRTIDELNREFPRESKSITRFYEDIGSVFFKSAKNSLSNYMARHTSAKGTINRYSFSPELYSFFDIQSRFFFRRPVTLLSLAELSLMIKTRPCRYYGGFNRLAVRLEALLNKRGVPVHNIEKDPEIHHKQRQSILVRCSHGDIEARTILTCIPEADLSVLYLGVNKDVMPVGMENDVLYHPDYSRPDDLIALSMNDNRDIDTVADGTGLLTATFLMKKHLMTKREMSLLVEPIIPFLGDHILCSGESTSFDNSSIRAENDLKSLKIDKTGPIIFRKKTHRAYLLQQRHYAPLHLISAIRYFVKQAVR